MYFNFDVAHKPPLGLFEVVGVQGRNFSTTSPLTLKDILECHYFAWSIKTSPNIEDTIKEMDVCALQVNQRDLYLDKSGLRWTAQILSGGFCSNVKIAAGQVFVTPPKLFFSLLK